MQFLGQLQVSCFKEVMFVVLKGKEAKEIPKWWSLEDLASAGSTAPCTTPQCRVRLSCWQSSAAQLLPHPSNLDQASKSAEQQMQLTGYEICNSLLFQPV